MRMLEYEVKLAERGYVVASGDMRGNPDSICERKCLPISLTAGSCNTDKQLIEAVCADAAHAFDDQGDDFCANYPKILLGQHPKWYLYCFEIHAGEIILEYYSSENDRQGFMVLQAKRGSVLKLHFDVPRQGDKPSLKYVVSLGEHYARITEPTDGTVLREVSITGSEDGTARLATISEFVDL